MRSFCARPKNHPAPPRLTLKSPLTFRPNLIHRFYIYLNNIVVLFVPFRWRFTMKVKFSYLLVSLLFISVASAQQAAAPAPQASSHATANAAAPAPDKIWADLMAGNERFAAGKAKPRSLVSLRQSLA